MWICSGRRVRQAGRTSEVQEAAPPRRRLACKAPALVHPPGRLQYMSPLMLCFRLLSSNAAAVGAVASGRGLCGCSMESCTLRHAEACSGPGRVVKQQRRCKQQLLSFLLFLFKRQRLALPHPGRNGAS